MNIYDASVNGVTTWEKAIKYVLDNEGGYVDHPDDLGGPTNHGITIETLARWLERPASPADVKALTVRKAKEIYYDHYWCPQECPKIKRAAIVTAIFDMSVLFGLRTTAVRAQKACNAYSAHKLKEDGFIGPNTLAALNDTSCTDFAFIKAFHRIMVERVDDLVEQRPKNLAFKQGWLNRVDRLMVLV